MAGEPSLRAFLEHRDTNADQQILKYLEVTLDDLAVNAGFTGDCRDIQRLALRETGRFEEAGERFSLSGQTFGNDFLSEICLHIGCQVLSGVNVLLRVVDRWQHPVLVRLLYREVRPEFRRRKREELVADCPARQQIARSPPQLAGTAAGEDEDQATSLDQPMHLVEECRYPLDLVDQDRLRAMGRYALRQSLRIGQLSRPTKTN